MLLNLRGEPIAPASANAFLATVDPLFFLKWVTGARQYWAIMRRWEARDPRRERIQRGELEADKDFDIFHFLPDDCPAEEVEGYVQRFFLRSGNKAQEAEQAVEATQKQNAAVKAKHLEAIKNDVFEETIRRDKHDNLVAAGVEAAHPMVTVAKDISPRVKKGK